MTVEELNSFVEEFNAKRNIGALLTISKKYNISIDELGEPVETDKDFIWTITSLGTLYQCKDCNAMEFVELGKKRKRDHK